MRINPEANVERDGYAARAVISIPDQERKQQGESVKLNRLICFLAEVDEGSGAKTNLVFPSDFHPAPLPSYPCR